GDLFLRRHVIHSGKGCPKRNRRDPKAPPAEGGEVLLLPAKTAAGSPTSRPRPLRPGGEGKRLRQVRRHVRHEIVGAPLELAARGAHLRLDAATVAAHETLHLRAVPLELALELVAGRGATTLELAEVRGHAALELRDLALGARAARERLHVLEHVVARGESGADGNQHGALGLKGNGLEALGLGLRAGRAGGRRVARGRASAARGRASAARGAAGARTGAGGAAAGG